MGPFHTQQTTEVKECPTFHHLGLLILKVLPYYPVHRSIYRSKSRCSRSLKYESRGPDYIGYQSFHHTVISPHDYSQYITVISSHLNHNKVGLTVSQCKRRTSSRPKSALGYAVVFVCVCCYFRPSIMNQQDR